MTQVALALPVPTAVRARPWVRGAAWDATWMLSALWLAPLVLLLSRGTGDPSEGPLDSLYFVGSAFLWLGHRVGSTWLAYATTAFRPLVRAQPVRFLIVPIAIAVICFALLLPEDDALPWSRAARLVGLGILDYLLVTYHFASQHFGVLSLYRLRAGRTHARGLRRWDRAYALVVGGFLVFVAEVVAGTVFFMDRWVNPWLDPDTVAAYADTIAAVGTAVVVVSTLALLALEARAARPSLPRALYIAGMGLMVGVAFHARTPFVFIVLWSVQHWIVATGLTTLVAQGEPDTARSRTGRALHAVNSRPWAMVLVLAVISVLLLPLLEVEAVEDGGHTYSEWIFGAFATALRTSTWVPALLALGFTTALWHYWLDRSVYRFSDPHVREAARGLMRTPTAS